MPVSSTASHVTKSSFAISRQFEEAMLESVIPRNIIAGFAANGVWPIDTTKFTLRDEATDISDVEQTPIVVRYVNEEHEVKENFLGSVRCSSTSGRASATHLTDFVTGVGLDMSYLRGQGYGGARNMAGK